MFARSAGRTRLAFAAAIAALGILLTQTVACLPATVFDHRCQSILAEEEEVVVVNYSPSPAESYNHIVAASYDFPVIVGQVELGDDDEKELKCVFYFSCLLLLVVVIIWECEACLQGKKLCSPPTITTIKTSCVFFKVAIHHRRHHHNWRCN